MAFKLQVFFKWIKLTPDQRQDARVLKEGGQLRNHNGGGGGGGGFHCLWVRYPDTHWSSEDEVKNSSLFSISTNKSDDTWYLLLKYYDNHNDFTKKKQ